jgi:hypothetical protein
MKKPYLIQRGIFKDVKGPITGIDQLISFDYMGSAEFEWGSMPKSLKVMCKEADLFEVYPTGFQRMDGVGVFIICKPVDKDTVMGYVEKLALNMYRLKEFSYFPEALEPKHSYDRIDFWWDIQNQYMFCLGKKNAQNVIKAIKAVREKKKAAGEKCWF